MAISNELSGDIAAAILGTKPTSGKDIADLKETVLRVHSILQELSELDREKSYGETVVKSSEAGAGH
jgi:hypothetical protein